MNNEELDDQPERAFAAVLGREPETWTSSCPPPESMIALAERAVPEPEAARLMAHVALCARCRREHAETLELVRLAQEVRELEQQTTTATAIHTPAPSPAPPAAPEAVGVPAWRRWFSPSLAFGLGAAVAGLILYFVALAPAREQRDRLASALRQREVASVRLQQELDASRLRNQGDTARLAQEAADLKRRLDAQGVQVARLERDAAALEQVPLPAPAWRLSGAGGQLRGGGTAEGHAPEIALVRPVETAVTDPTPILECRPVTGATQYQVTFELQDSNEELPAPQRLSPTSWRAARPLPPGRVYQWSVTARRKDEAVRSRVARFYVLSDAERQELQAARQRHAKNPLALGAVYARLGMNTEAAQQFREALKADPAQATARRWLAELEKSSG
jgi:hypothetical protein